MINGLKYIAAKFRDLFDKDKSSYAFSFNADDPMFGGWYGGPCEDVLLASLFKNDFGRKCRSLVLRGDLIIYRRAEKYLGVSRKKFGGRNSVSWAVGVDGDSYLAMFWDLVDSIALTWHTTDDDTFPISILKRNTFIIYFPTISRKLVSQIDSDLKSFTPYYGVFEVDRGNPLHVALLDEQLVDDSFVDDGIIYTKKDSDDTPCNLLGADSEELGKKVVHLYEQDFSSKKPKLSKKRKLSKRGLETLDLLEGTRKESHYQNLAESLRDMASKDHDGKEFEFSIPKGFERLTLQREKLVDYALNLKHPSGGHKAVLFRDLLGITDENWEYLNDQIIETLPNAKLHKTRVSEHGIQYHALVPIVGLNGRKANVLTAWFVDQGGYARLTTLYIASKKDQEKYG
ncbi:MAG: DUF6883 domain-containing protein [Candidatus Paceibacterota bacterium]|jgi:hypothetical protein